MDYSPLQINVVNQLSVGRTHKIIPTLNKTRDIASIFNNSANWLVRK